MDVRITCLKIISFSGIKEEIVVFAGITAGEGYAFGLIVDVDVDDGDFMNKDNLDGFLTKILGSNGNFWNTADPSTKIPVHNQAYTTQIQLQCECTNEVKGTYMHPQIEQ